MLDLDVFAALRRRDFECPGLVDGLEALATLPLVERVAYLGALEGALEHGPPALRVAALGALARANGKLAFSLALRALDDGDERVRRAAIEAFASSASRQPSRFVHVLFHARADVRRLALEALPERQSALGLYLLADPENAASARSWFDGERVEHAPEGGLWLLLGLVRRRLVDASLAARWLERTDTSAVLTLAQKGVARDEDSIDAIVAALSASDTDRGADVLDDLFAIAFAAPPELRRVLVQRLLAAFVADGKLDRQRVAAAIVAAARPMFAQALAALVLCLPDTLKSSTFSLELRRAAALASLELDVRAPVLEKAALTELVRELPLDSEGTIDVALLAAVLRFGKAGDTYAVLTLVFEEERLVRALLRDPVESAPIFSSKCLVENDRRALLASLRAHARERIPELCALAITALPLDQVDLFGAMDAEEVFSAAQALLALESQRPAAWRDRKLSRVVDALVDVLLTGERETLLARCAALARTWLGAPSPEDSALGPKLFSRMVRELPAEDFVEICRTLPEGALERLVRLLPYCHEIQFGKELALAHALLSGSSELLRGWARERAGPGEAPIDRREAPLGRVLVLADTEQRALATAAEADLALLTERLHQVPSLGLCTALNARTTTDAPSMSVCIALLGAHESAELVVPLLARYSEDASDFWSTFDARAVRTWAHTEDLPLLGAAWLWRWERQSFRLAELAEARPGGLRGLLDWALSLPLAPLRVALWSAVARCLALFGARDKNRFWELCGDGRAFADAAIEQLDTELGLPAAEVLLALKSMAAPAIVPALPRVRNKLPDVSAAVALELGRLLQTQGLTFRREAARHHARSVGESDVRAIRWTTDLDRLEAACASKSEPLVQESVLRLLELEGGVERLARVLELEPPVFHAGAIADSIALWPDCDALGGLRAALDREALPPELRFRIGVSFAERGERALLEGAYRAANALFTESWFKARDYEKLCALDSPASTALALARSPHPHAYNAAIAFLLERDDVPLEARADALVAFLAAGRERLLELRLKAALWLLARGNDYGFPLLFAKALDEGDDAYVRGASDGALFELATRGVLVGGQALAHERILVELLASAPIGIRDRVLEQVLIESYDETAAREAVAQLDRRRARAGKLRELAELFAWGFRTGLMLTGRHHRPHMTSDGAYGYVRRNDPRVYVTPLPLLRGDPNGTEIVEGLILHELGHHRWHSGPSADKIWAAAEKQRIHGILNLVADEHLERNLRAMHAPWGDKLKRLAAYAFQHADKEIEVGALLGMLGASAFAALTRCSLELSPVPTRVKVGSGALLHALEAQGHPFARFVRALRMGLGNRHDDPLVEQALALFRSGFRKLDMAELFEIAKKLRRLFGDQTAILDGFGGAETVDEGEREGTKARSGLNDDQVQPEVERILDPRQLKNSKHSDGGGPGAKLAINVSGVPHFNTIDTVKRLVVDPVAQRQAERDVARPAAQLRRFFEQLGVQRDPITRRTSGTRLDRGRLQALVLYRDPRVLTARQPRFDTDLFLGVLVDCSSSMQTADNIIKARRFAVLVAEAAKGLPGIDVRVFGFTDSVIYDAGDARRSAAASLEANGGNNDAAGLLHLAGVAKQSRRRAKVLVVVSDGLPTECSAEALKSLASRLEKRERMVIAQVAVRPIEEPCFTHYVRLDQGEIGEVVRKFGQTLASLVRKALH
jgi:hypothetical protein